MPKSTSYLEAFDRQHSITLCQSSIIDLLAVGDDFSTVDRDDFSFLLHFLRTELLEDDSWSSLRQDKAHRHELFLNCYQAVDDLTCAEDSLSGVNRDDFFLMLNFLHGELIQINQILDCLNSASNNQLDEPEVKLPFVYDNSPLKQNRTYSSAVGE